MKIAFVQSPHRGQTDQLISEAAARLEAEGLRLLGAVKVLQDEDPQAHDCDMDLRVLPGGPVIQITQSLGPGSTGCRLNPMAIAEAVAATERNISDQFDLFILNKFGLQEAEGRGFSQAIGMALEQGAPVLLGVGSAHREALLSFTDGVDEEIAPDLDAICDWCRAALKDRD